MFRIEANDRETLSFNNNNVILLTSPSLILSRSRSESFFHSGIVPLEDYAMLVHLPFFVTMDGKK